VSTVTPRVPKWIACPAVQFDRAALTAASALPSRGFSGTVDDRAAGAQVITDDLHGQHRGGRHTRPPYPRHGRIRQRDLTTMDTHRSILRDGLLSLCREQRRLLREESMSSRLPSGLGDLTGQPAIKIRFEDAPDDEAGTRLADRVDIWASELASNPERASSAAVRARRLANAVRDTVLDRSRAGAWSIEILKATHRRSSRGTPTGQRPIRWDEHPYVVQDRHAAVAQMRDGLGGLHLGQHRIDQLDRDLPSQLAPDDQRRTPRCEMHPTLLS
jgi:hypothetical protein